MCVCAHAREQMLASMNALKAACEHHTCCDDDVSLTLLVLELELMTFCRDVLSFCFCRFSMIDAISGLGLGTAGSDNSGIWIGRKKQNCYLNL